MRSLKVLFISLMEMVPFAHWYMSSTSPPTSLLNPTPCGKKREKTSASRCLYLLSSLSIHCTSLWSMVIRGLVACRYCLSNDYQPFMVSPCNCNGSVKYVHISCLYKWHMMKKTLYCPTCKMQYIPPSINDGVVAMVTTLEYVFFIFLTISNAICGWGNG